MTGWICLHRQVMEWEWYTDANTVRLFIHLLLKANHTNKQWRGVEVNRGSFITSYSHLSSELNLSVKQIRVSMDKLKRTGEVASRATSKYSVITVLNYDLYQSEGKQKGDQGASEGQAKGKRRATTNNDNNEDNDNNETKEPKTPCSPQAHVDLKDDQNLTPEYFDKPPYPHDDNSADAIAWRTVEYLNERAGRSFQQISSNHKWIKQRLKSEQADEYTLKRVIDHKAAEWTCDKMKLYLRPQTLFAKDNYLKYLDEIELKQQEHSEMQQLIEDMKDPNWVNPIDAMRKAYENDTTTY